MSRVLLLTGLSCLVVVGAANSREESVSAQFQKMYAEYLEACMKDWDNATHMTKSQWRRTCERVAGERAKFRAEQGDQVKPKQQ